MPMFAAIVIVSLLAALALAVTSVRAQLSANAALNPRWPPHARFHAATYGLTLVGASLLAAGLLAAGLLAGQLFSARSLTFLAAIALLATMDLVELGVDAIPEVRALGGPGVKRWPRLLHLCAVLVAGALALGMEP